MGLFGSRGVLRDEPEIRQPRDIEALEELVANLESATDEASTWRIFASTSLEFYDFSSSAVWIVENGLPRFEYGVGPIAAALTGTESQAGLVQQAIRVREP